MSTVLTLQITHPRRIRVGTLALERGDELRNVQIAYETYGDENAPAVLVLGGISASRHLLPTEEEDRKSVV